MNQTLENRRKPNFGLFCPNLHPPPPNFFVVPLLDARHCSKLSLYAIFRNTYDLNSRKRWKTSFWAWFRPIGPTFGPPIFFFFKNLTSSVTRYHGQLSSCKILEKTNDPILRKIREERTNGRTYRPKDRHGLEWFHRTLSEWLRVSEDTCKAMRTLL